MNRTKEKLVLMILISCTTALVLCGCNQNSMLNGTYRNEETGFSIIFDGKKTCSIAQLQNYCFGLDDDGQYLKVSNPYNTMNFFYRVTSEGNATYCLTDDNFAIFGFEELQRFRFTYESGTNGLAISSPQFDASYKYTDYESSHLVFYSDGTLNVMYDKPYKRDGGLLYIGDIPYANKYDEATKTLSIKTIFGWEDLVQVK